MERLRQLRLNLEFEVESLNLGETPKNREDVCTCDESCPTCDRGECYRCSKCKRKYD